MVLKRIRIATTSQVEQPLERLRCLLPYTAAKQVLLEEILKWIGGEVGISACQELFAGKRCGCGLKPIYNEPAKRTTTWTSIYPEASRCSAERRKPTKEILISEGLVTWTYYPLHISERSRSSRRRFAARSVGSHEPLQGKELALGVRSGSDLAQKD